MLPLKAKIESLAGDLIKYYDVCVLIRYIINGKFKENILFLLEFLFFQKKELILFLIV